MVAHIRRNMQTAVDLVRGTLAIIKGRSVPDLAVLNQAEAVHEAALALQDNFIAPDPARFAAVVEEIRNQIAGLDAERMRGDTSGLDGIKNRVSRAICEEQLDLIDRLHLVQAVVLGAEQGLRVLIEAKPVTGRRIRDGPEPGGRNGKPATRQRMAAVRGTEPVQAVERESEKGSHGRTQEAAADAKGGSRTTRPLSGRPDTSRGSIVQHRADTGTRQIAADTLDL